MQPMLLELARVVLVLGGMASLVGLGIVLLNRWSTNQTPRDSLADRVNSLLPQIQCAQCGYPGCRPYAEAILEGANIDLCTPGGNETAQSLAELLDRPLEIPDQPIDLNAVATIGEEECVGCALCIKACPVDAIIGALRFMHTVHEDLCTGCELCVPVCPVDCIDMVARSANA